MFNLEEFKTALEPFGTLTYAKIFDEGLPSENLEFAVDTINMLCLILGLLQLIKFYLITLI